MHYTFVDFLFDKLLGITFCLAFVTGIAEILIVKYLSRIGIDIKKLDKKIFSNNYIAYPEHIKTLKLTFIIAKVRNAMFNLLRISIVLFILHVIYLLFVRFS